MIALLVVASIGAIGKAQDSGQDRLNASDAKISPTDQAYYPGATSSTTVPNSSTTTTAGTIGVHLTATPTVTLADASGNRWQVTVTFTLVDSSGNGVIGATMNGGWTDGGNGSNPSSTCTTSSSAGQCTVQFTKIRDTVPTVTYTLSTITGGTFAWTPVAGGEGVLVVNCGSLC